MHYLLPILGTIATVIASLVTLILARGMKLFTMRAPSGPDSMALAGVFYFQIAGLVFLMLGAFMALGRGGFDWISSAGGVPTLAVLIVGVALSVLAVVAAAHSMNVNDRWRTLAGVAGALCLPLSLCTFVLLLLWLPLELILQSSWPRIVGWVLAGMAALVYLAAVVAWYAAKEARGQREIERELERQAEHERFAQESREKDVLDAAALAATPDDAPLEQFLSHLFIDKSEAHHPKALARIDGLPNLAERIAQRLAHPLPIQREYCSNYIRHTSNPHPEFVPALKHAMLMLAQDYHDDLLDPSRDHITHPKGLTLGTILTAQRYAHGTFKDEAHVLRAAVSTWPESDERNEALECIDRYLRGERLPT